MGKEAREAGRGVSGQKARGPHGCAEKGSGLHGEY